MVDLSGLDSNKYKSILQEKYKALSNKNHLSENIIPVNMPLCNKKIDEFGETAIEHLKQPYRRKFSDDEIEQIISDYKSIKSTIKIAEKFGCNKNTIKNLLKQHGVNVTRAKAQAKLDIAQVIKMYEAGNTIKEIAKHFDVSKHTIGNCLKDNNVKIRSRWDYADK